MKLINVLYEGAELPALLVLNDSAVMPLRTLLGEHAPATLLQLIQRDSPDIIVQLKHYQEHPDQATIPVDRVKILAPIPRPLRNIICLGLNYYDHVAEIIDEEGNPRPVPDTPVYFSKMTSRIIGTEETIQKHAAITDTIDYEVELVAVIGKKGVNIPPASAYDYIFGYSILNDLTARNLQRKHGQWMRGKSLDSFAVMGPAIVHESMFDRPPELDIQCTVNGELRQNSNTRHCIFDLPYIISDLSKGFTLLPGDMIATGTPAGVGMGSHPPRFLRPNDSIICTIEGIGSLVNRMEP